jgi:hypothetical protein
LVPQCVRLQVPLETELEELDDDSDEDGTGMRLT